MQPSLQDNRTSISNDASKVEDDDLSAHVERSEEKKKKKKWSSAAVEGDKYPSTKEPYAHVTHACPGYRIQQGLNL
ncbi:hypothetical protein LMH87_001116 [Akanthomyces muscarius]|uniref:Uncharacterized protein n=1 Tax=Akanthomyces muscarius TaxID=2231603 RepID=A0A9W8QJ86_AKAMU|nr:hypothetical protein LMH87_001116 [Akanthomyces muscarius]KAJ4155893.1 hypothetical protein LMH87_001116 [Akanthomyces muscarius]